MSESIFVTGMHRLTGKPVHVENVERGNLAGASCYSCGGILISKKGRVNAWHFAHKSKNDCSGESNLHKYAKYILAEKRALCVRNYPKPLKPSRHEFNYAIIEHPVDKFRIDCLLCDEKTPPLAVEIKVTHPTSEDKIAMFRRKKLAAIEIDLSGLSRLSSVKEIQREVCANHNNTSWLYNAKHEEHNKKRIQEYYQEFGWRHTRPWA
tara:strand:+ start:86 stop:709 length:624 start_codon:yes stop_codon:yes gene_type:complete